MKKSKFLFYILAFISTMVFVFSIACQPREDLIAPPTDLTEESPQTSIESVIGDVDIVYPIVPEDGKDGGVVTMPLKTTVTAQTSVSQSPVSGTKSTGVSPSVKYTTEMSFKPFDSRGYIGPPKYGEIYLTVTAAPGNIIHVKLTGPNGAVTGTALHEVYMDNNGIGVTSWDITMSGEYVASGTFFRPMGVDFSDKLVVK